MTEGGREAETDKIKHRSDFRTYSEDKHKGRRLRGGESQTREKSLTLWLFMIASEICQAAELHTPHTPRYKPLSPNMPDATSEESSPQSLHSLCLFLCILACQSQAEGGKGFGVWGVERVLVVVVDCQVSSLTMETAVRAAAVFFFHAVFFLSLPLVLLLPTCRSTALLLQQQGYK